MNDRLRRLEAAIDSGDREAILALPPIEASALWRRLVERDGYRSDEKARRVIALGLSFPTLADAAVEIGFDLGWSARALERWAFLSGSSGGRHAALFVLGVWNTYHVYLGGRFDLHAAWPTWDDAHRQAALDWLNSPWWA